MALPSLYEYTMNNFDYIIKINELRDPVTGPIKFLTSCFTNTPQQVINTKIISDQISYQVKLLQSISRNNKTISEGKRQAGKSTALAVYALWSAIYNSSNKVTVVTPDNSSRRNLISIVKTIYEGIDRDYKSIIDEESETIIAFTNNSLIRFVINDTTYVSETDVLLVDEFNSCKNQEIILKSFLHDDINIALVSSSPENN